ncbi:MAG: nucleotidyltransferase family protein [Eubacterium sp.]
MKKEEKLLIRICQCFLNGDSLSLPNNINWKDFYILAKNHNLMGVCHCVFNDNKELDIEQNIRRLFTDRFYDLIYRFEMQTNAFNDVKECLARAEIYFIPFKGAVLRNLYPVPEGRSMGDIDLIIKEADKDKADKALAENGFNLHSSNAGVCEYLRNGMILEVHTRLFSEFGDKAFNDAFENAVFNGFEGQFDDSYHFAYLIAHTANHLKYTGAGIRFVLDLAVMQKKKQIDFEKVFKILKEIGLETFGRVILTVCNEWFGVGESFVENTDRIQKYLIEDGVFGSLKDSNSATVSRLMQCEAFDSDNGKKRSSLVLKLKLAFPPYSTLRKATYIKFLNGRPWLLPVAWCYRFYYSLKNNRKHMLQTVKNIDDEKTAVLVKEELEFFEEIGIYG